VALRSTGKNHSAARLFAPHFKPYSVLAVTLFRKGGGKPPHSKVSWLRVNTSGYAIGFSP
jgi:hypothetical protein